MVVFRHICCNFKGQIERCPSIDFPDVGLSVLVIFYPEQQRREF